MVQAVSYLPTLFSEVLVIAQFVLGIQFSHCVQDCLLRLKRVGWSITKDHGDPEMLFKVLLTNYAILFPQMEEVLVGLITT